MRFGRYQRKPDTTLDNFYRLDGTMAIISGRGACTLGNAMPKGRSKGKNATPAKSVLSKSSIEFHARQKHKLEKTK